MRKLTVFLVLAAMALSTAAFAQYTGPWTQTWDFEDGLQGWTLSGSCRWVDPAVEPNGPSLPDVAVSGAGAGNLYLPDKSTAKIDVSSLNLGSGAGRNGFIFQADVYVPNLLPVDVGIGQPGNGIHQAGIGAISTGGSEVYVEGKNDKTRATTFARDRNWDNKDRWMAPDILKQPGDQSEWWDDWVTMQIDYNFTVPGKWTGWVYIPWVSLAGEPGWYQASDGAGNYWFDCAPDGGGYSFTQLRLGGVASWTQAQFDNAKLAVVPEPSSMLALASGLFGMAGFAIRRRK